MKVKVNKEGYWVTFRKTPDGPRTYACTDRNALYHLIERMTERPIDSFVRDERDIPLVPDCSIAYPLHIYGDGAK